MSTEQPWVRWFPANWLTGSRGLTPTETTIYITVLNLIYEKDGPVDADPATLGRYCLMTKKAAETALEKLVEKRKLKLVDGRYSNQRAEDEIARKQEMRKTQSKNAKKRKKPGRASGSLGTQLDVSHERVGKKAHKNNGTPQPMLPLGSANAQPNKKEEIRTKKQESVANATGQKSKRASRLPEDWKIPNEWIGEAVAEGLTQAAAMAEAEAMKNWSLSAPSGAKLDWRAAWRNWYRRRLANPSGAPQPRNRGDPPDDDFRRELDRITKGG